LNSKVKDFIPDWKLILNFTGCTQYRYPDQKNRLPNHPEISALADYVTETNRGTVLKRGEFQVCTIEHAMAALYASGIDNCQIEVDAPEFPIIGWQFDRYFIRGILQVGIEDQPKTEKMFCSTKRMEYKHPETGAKIVLLPDDKFSVDVHIGFDSPILSNQFASIESMDEFEKKYPKQEHLFLYVK